MTVKPPRINSPAKAGRCPGCNNVISGHTYPSLSPAGYRCPHCCIGLAYRKTNNIRAFGYSCKVIYILTLISILIDENFAPLYIKMLLLTTSFILLLLEFSVWVADRKSGFFTITTGIMCPKCGYDMGPNKSDTCPECGASTKMISIPPSPPQPKRVDHHADRTQ
jgi:hypothetical protein